MFLDRDVVHAGGIAPSGLRCHGFLYDTNDKDRKKNTHHTKDNRELYLNRQFMIPFTDNKPYDNKWFYEQLGIEHEIGSMKDNFQEKI